MTSADIDDAAAFLEWLERRDAELRRDSMDDFAYILHAQMPPPLEDKAVSIRRADNLYRGLVELIESAVEVPHTGWLDMRLGQGTHTWDAKVALETIDGPIVVQFADGSLYGFHGDGSGYPIPGYRNSHWDQQRTPVDSGPALLEAITDVEFIATEGVLAVLWQALDSDDLSEVQRAQIIAMAELIAAERNATQPGETKRWKLIGVVRGALHYLVKEAPRDALAWWKLAEILQGINWHEVASHLPH